MKNVANFRANTARLDGSNLGQIIGRMLYAHAMPLPAPSAPSAAPVRAQYVRRGYAKIIVDVLAKHPEGLRARQIAQLAGVENVSVVNAYVSQMPEVRKSGPRGSYLYTLKNPPRTGDS